MSEKTKKGNSLKIVIIVLLILIVVGGAAAGAYIIGQKGSGAKTTIVKVVESNEITFPLEEFLVNLMDEDGKRYLKVKVVIGYEDNADLTAELTAKTSIIRDVVITTLRAKKTTDFSATGVDAIKSQLIKSINPILTKGKASHIYFNDILVQ
ncbi:flagellar basal body-associated protein FliL [Clostridium sp. FP1]|uniref:flagellar basal body-associated FliL family protein n=1 Tax=Clostridium sp. FP1 TaxID=2724076 RepID=UPI0013E99348|nr:flagellar basal body-associated FliL family protein [Clostridium sp. FP1]MBZ9635977.1 flagellar basal body-associated FliL family protein [Clostridium sp. FP1]